MYDTSSVFLAERKVFESLCAFAQTDFESVPVVGLYWFLLDIKGLCWNLRPYESVHNIGLAVLKEKRLKAKAGRQNARGFCHCDHSGKPCVQSRKSVTERENEVCRIIQGLLFHKV